MILKDNKIYIRIPRNFPAGAIHPVINAPVEGLEEALQKYLNECKEHNVGPYLDSCLGHGVNYYCVNMMTAIGRIISIDHDDIEVEIFSPDAEVAKHFENDTVVCISAVYDTNLRKISNIVKLYTIPKGNR